MKNVYLGQAPKPPFVSFAEFGYAHKTGRLLNKRLSLKVIAVL